MDKPDRVRGIEVSIETDRNILHDAALTVVPAVKWFAIRRHAALLPLRPHPSYFLPRGHRHSKTGNDDLPSYIGYGAEPEYKRHRASSSSTILSEKHAENEDRLVNGRTPAVRFDSGKGFSQDCGVDSSGRSILRSVEKVKTCHGQGSCVRSFDFYRNDSVILQKPHFRLRSHSKVEEKTVNERRHAQSHDSLSINSKRSHSLTQPYSASQFGRNGDCNHSVCDSDNSKSRYKNRIEDSCELGKEHFHDITAALKHQQQPQHNVSLESSQGSFFVSYLNPQAVLQQAIDRKGHNNECNRNQSCPQSHSQSVERKKTTESVYCTLSKTRTDSIIDRIYFSNTKCPSLFHPPCSEDLILRSDRSLNHHTTHVDVLSATSPSREVLSNSLKNRPVSHQNLSGKHNDSGYSSPTTTPEVTATNIYTDNSGDNFNKRQPGSDWKGQVSGERLTSSVPRPQSGWNMDPFVPQQRLAMGTSDIPVASSRTQDMHRLTQTTSSYTSDGQTQATHNHRRTEQEIHSLNSRHNEWPLSSATSAQSRRPMIPSSLNSTEHPAASNQKSYVTCAATSTKAAHSTEDPNSQLQASRRNFEESVSGRSASSTVSRKRPANTEHTDSQEMSPQSKRANAVFYHRQNSTASAATIDENEHPLNRKQELLSSQTRQFQPQLQTVNMPEQQGVDIATGIFDLRTYNPGSATDPGDLEVPPRKASRGRGSRRRRGRARGNSNARREERPLLPHPMTLPYINGVWPRLSMQQISALAQSFPYQIHPSPASFGLPHPMQFSLPHSLTFPMAQPIPFDFNRAPAPSTIGSQHHQPGGQDLAGMGPHLYSSLGHYNSTGVDLQQSHNAQLDQMSEALKQFHAKYPTGMVLLNNSGHLSPSVIDSSQSNFQYPDLRVGASLQYHSVPLDLTGTGSHQHRTGQFEPTYHSVSTAPEVLASPREHTRKTESNVEALYRGNHGPKQYCPWDIQPKSLASTQPHHENLHPKGMPQQQYRLVEPDFTQPGIQQSNESRSQPTRESVSMPISGSKKQPTSVQRSQCNRDARSQPTIDQRTQRNSKLRCQPSCEQTQQSKEPIIQANRKVRSQPTSEPRHQPTSEPRHQPTSEPRHQPSSEPRHQPSSEPRNQSSCEQNQPTSVTKNQPNNEPRCQSPREQDQSTNTPRNQTISEDGSKIRSLFSRPLHQPSNIPESQPENDVTQTTSEQRSQSDCEPKAQPSISEPRNQAVRELINGEVSQSSSQLRNQSTCQPASKLRGKGNQPFQIINEVASQLTDEEDQPFSEPSQLSKEENVPSSEPRNHTSMKQTSQLSEEGNLPVSELRNQTSREPSDEKNLQTGESTSRSDDEQTQQQDTVSPASLPLPCELPFLLSGDPTFTNELSITDSNKSQYECNVKKWRESVHTIWQEKKDCIPYFTTKATVVSDHPLKPRPKYMCMDRRETSCAQHPYDTKPDQKTASMNLRKETLGTRIEIHQSQSEVSRSGIPAQTETEAHLCQQDIERQDTDKHSSQTTDTNLSATGTPCHQPQALQSAPEAYRPNQPDGEADSSLANNNQCDRDIHYSRPETNTEVFFLQPQNKQYDKEALSPLPKASYSDTEAHGFQPVMSMSDTEAYTFQLATMQHDTGRPGTNCFQTELASCSKREGCQSGTEECCPRPETNQMYTEPISCSHPGTSQTDTESHEPQMQLANQPETEPVWPPVQVQRLFETLKLPSFDSDDNRFVVTKASTLAYNSLVQVEDISP